MSHLKVRVLHLPYLTPYVRKLSPGSIEVVNCSPANDAVAIPPDFNFTWLSRQKSYDFFDVLHLHFLDICSLKEVKQVLQKCRKQGKRIIYTAHDVTRLHDDEGLYLKKLKCVCSYANGVIALTPSSAQVLLKRVKQRSLCDRITIIPHGWSVDPAHPKWGSSGGKGKTVEYAMYGAFRHNREFYITLVNWYYSLLQYDARFSIFALPVNNYDMETVRPYLRETISFIQTDPRRMLLFIFPSLTDEQIIDFISECDILMMPYLWGSHSGQLELAFDMNVIPVISNVGYYHDQWKVVSEYVPEPIIFNWSDERFFNYGNRLVEALMTSYSKTEMYRAMPVNEKFRQYRIKEHEEILKMHSLIYIGDQKISSEYFPSTFLI
jgi:glycosyltransferase involved in cell wall biosynthesis